jgi:hypothetical protein
MVPAMESLPPYVNRTIIAERLPLIFPEGTPNRGYCIRELAASTIFAAIYIGAIEGSGRYLGPVHVYRMTRQQAVKSSDKARGDYALAVRRKSRITGTRWYADNTREPIRDETLRDGLVVLGAITSREDLPTTSGAPRYALRREFASLFDPALQGEALDRAITQFRNDHLSKSALARVSIMLAGAVDSASKVEINFPNGERRHLVPGPSSLIAKAVIEVFAGRFLEKPAVLWLSESKHKVVMRDDRIANAIGLRIEPDKNLPDIILADLGPRDPLLVFVEVVASDGAITPRRQAALHALTDAAGFDRRNVAFLTAYRDRDASVVKRTVSQLAWQSFAWFASEPDAIVMMHTGAGRADRLHRLMAAAL